MPGLKRPASRENGDYSVAKPVEINQNISDVGA